MNYIKYYFLEEYLLGEVQQNFCRRGYLLPEEFFCIIIWKANRAKTKIKEKLSKRGRLERVIKELTEDINKTPGKEGKLEILLSKWNLYLPMATAILTILYPKDFTIYDIRVRKQVGLKELYSANKYFSDFLPKIKKIAKEKGLSLRDTDRYLWGESFYKDLKKLTK